MNNVAGRLEKETQFYEKMEKKLQDLPEIFNEYFIFMRANRKTYTTINVYINNLLHFARFVTKGNITDDFYKNITPTHVESYMIALETKKTKDGVQRVGDDILQARWSSLNTFFTWLVKRGYIMNNPITVDRPKNNTEHKVTYLTKIEMNKLFKAISNNPSPVIAVRDKTLFSLALATGLRVSALTNINIEDIDFENNLIQVVEKRKKVREIPIGENIQELLREWIIIRNQEFDDVDTSALFLSQKRNRLSGDAANDALKKYCEEAGIQKKITMHKLRSSAACTLAKNNVPVKAIAKQLGHNNIAVTMRYIDVFDEDSEKAKNILDGLF
jgi:site-specific recombinase XerD